VLYDPRWPWHAAAELGATVRPPKQYLRSQPSKHRHLFGVNGPVGPMPTWVRDDDGAYR